MEWVRLSIIDMLDLLDQRYGDLGVLARQFMGGVVKPSLREGVLVCSASGDNFQEANRYGDSAVLGVQLYFDGLSTASNALGRAATTTRKYYVFSFRLINVPATLKSSRCILPIAVVPPAAYERYGFDGIMRTLTRELQLLHTGTHRNHGLNSLQGID